MEVSGQLHTPATLNPKQDPWYLLDSRLGGTKGRSGRNGEEKKESHHCPCWELNPGHPVRSRNTKSKTGPDFLFAARPYNICNPLSLLSSGCWRLSVEGIKWLERETDLSLPSSSKVKNIWSVISTVSVCVHGVVLRHRSKFIF
jgi:hypothetical protein